MLLAEIRDYTQLIDALRRRTDEVEVSRLAIDERAGLASGYAGKVLSANGVRHIGPTSLGPILQTLGVRLLLCEDPQTRAAITDKLPKRRTSHVRNGTTHWRNAGPDPVKDHLATAGMLGGVARRDKLTPEQRRERARKARQARTPQKEPTA